MRLTRKQKYQRNRSHLRKLLKHFRDGEGGRTPVSGKFGYVFNHKYAYHQIVNTLNGTVIATVKQRGDKLIIRYRPNSWYSDLLSDNTKFVGQRFTRAVAVPSGRLGRHRGDAVASITEAVREAEMRAEQDRIAREEAMATIPEGVLDNVAFDFVAPDRASFEVTSRMRDIQQHMMDEYMQQHPFHNGATVSASYSLTDADIIRTRDSMFAQEFTPPQPNVVFSEEMTTDNTPWTIQEQLDSLREEENVDI